MPCISISWDDIEVRRMSRRQDLTDADADEMLREIVADARFVVFKSDGRRYH